MKKLVFFLFHAFFQHFFFHFLLSVCSTSGTSTLCYRRFKRAKIWDRQKFLILTEISAIFAPNGAVFRKISKKKHSKNSFFQKRKELVFLTVIITQNVFQKLSLSETQQLKKQKQKFYNISFVSFRNFAVKWLKEKCT